jgi:phage shock protein A
MSSTAYAQEGRIPMSLIKEIVNRLRGAEEQAATQVRDPVTDAVISIEDSKKEAARFESNIAQLMAQTADFGRQVDDTDKEAKKWAGIAEQCVREGKDEDAKKALQFQQEAEERLATAKSELAKN